jgi:hypothetical protein
LRRKPWDKATVRYRAEDDVTENGTSIRRMGSRRATLDGVELLKLKGDKVIDSGVAEILIRFGAHGLIRKGGEL